MNHILKSILFMLLFFIYLNLSAQENSTSNPKENRNIIKINLSALVWKNISLQYERKIGKRYSFAVNAHYIPFGVPPFTSLVDKLIEDPSVKINEFKFGNEGIVPELRVYVGKKGALRGFYVGAFAAINNYKSDFPVTYQNGSKTGIFSGKLTTYTFGLQVGAQFKLSKHFVLDWWIIGPNIGSAKGEFSFLTPLSSDDQLSVRDELENLNNSLPFKVIESYSVNAAGASISANGLWGGLRGLGINLGYRF